MNVTPDQLLVLIGKQTVQIEGLTNQLVASRRANIEQGQKLAELQKQNGDEVPPAIADRIDSGKPAPAG